MEDQGIIHLYLQRSQQAILETKNKYGAYLQSHCKKHYFKFLGC